MTQNGWTRSASTIAEVAHAAGVSRATVSRVMNGRSTVDPELAARVREVAEQLHYRPSNTARSLSLGRTNTVAVVVPDLANPMFQQVLRGVASAAAEEGYRVLVADTAEHAADEERIALDARLRCDALVLVSPRMPEQTLRALLPEIRPVVVVNRAADGTTPTLAIDYAAGIDQIVEHLTGLGHRHLLYLAGPTDSASHGARLDALRVAAARREDVRLSERPRGRRSSPGTPPRRTCWRRAPPPSSPTTTSSRSGCSRASTSSASPCPGTCRSRVSTTSSWPGSRRPR